MISVFAFNRKLSATRWLALLMLTAGVIIVQTDGETPVLGAENPVLGTTAVVAGATISGSASLLPQAF